MLPGWLHDPVRECSSEETESITMYYTWRCRKDCWIVWFWVKAYPKFSFLYSMWTLPLVCLKEKVESSKDVGPLAQTFIFLREAHWFVCYRIFEYIIWMSGMHSLVQMRYTTLQCKCKVMRRILNYFFNWLSDPVNEWRVSALKGQLSKCLNVGSADPCVLVSYSVIASIPRVLLWMAFFSSSSSLIVIANTDVISMSVDG